MQVSMKIFSAVLFVLLASGAINSLHSETQTSHAGLFFLDAAVPGFGSFYNKSYLAGSLFAVSRAGTVYLALHFWTEQQEYRSAARAARAAEVYFGPGYRYDNPYGRGYYNAEEFQRIADRRSFFFGLSLTTELILTVYSLLYTKSLIDDSEEKNIPVFEIKPETSGNILDRNFLISGDRPREGMRFNAGVILRDF